MSSLRQIEANRRNALLSTGPTTPEGRAAVARNALRHGLAAHDPVINIEDRAAYQALLQALIDEHRPSTPTQSLLVEQLAIASWRLARIRSIEAGLFEFRLYTLRKNMKREHPDLDDRGRLAFVFRYDVIQTSILLALSRYESRAERSFFKNLHELQRLKAASPAPEVSDSGIGFVQSTLPGTIGPGPENDPDDDPSPLSSSGANSIEDFQKETPQVEDCKNQPSGGPSGSDLLPYAMVP